VSIVVPSRKEDPRNQSATSVFSTAGWHEREAYDLVGIDYEGHPDLRRILLPETWQGPPLSLDYDRQQPQVVTLAEHGEGLTSGGTAQAEVTGQNEGSGQMFINIGPHHPATHGVLHLETRLDGEQVAHVEPDIGYLHRCEEQMCQQGTYRHKIIPYADRWDYTANMPNEWAPARAIEDLADIEVPEYAQVLRTMATELGRMLGHFLALATYALDIYGDFTAIFQYGIRDRETVQSILEDLTGQRMMFYYFRVGGVAWDLPTPRQEFIDKVRQFIDELPGRLEEYHHLITNNELYPDADGQHGHPSNPTWRRDYGVTGLVARASGVDYDVRRDDPYGYYDETRFSEVATADGCDNYARLLVRDARGRGVRPHRRPVPGPAVADWPEDERTLQSNVPRTLKPESDSDLPTRRSSPPRARWASTFGATGPPAPPGSRSGAPASTTSRRSPRWPRAR